MSLPDRKSVYSSKLPPIHSCTPVLFGRGLPQNFHCVHASYLFSICHLPGALYIHHRPLLSTPVASTVTPKVPMGLRTCWKSCGTLPWRSWTFRVALKFRPPRGRSCASWTNLREANFYECLVLQTWLRCLASSFTGHVFFSNVKGHGHDCFFDNIWQH